MLKFKDIRGIECQFSPATNASLLASKKGQNYGVANQVEWCGAGAALAATICRA